MISKTYWVYRIFFSEIFYIDEWDGWMDGWMDEWDGRMDGMVTIGQRQWSSKSTIGDNNALTVSSSDIDENYEMRTHVKGSTEKILGFLRKESLIS